MSRTKFAWRNWTAFVLLGGALATGYALLRADARAALGELVPPVDAALVVSTPDVRRVGDLEAELARERARASELEATVRELEAELGLVQTQRLERELNFLDFTSAVATFDPDGSFGRFARELLSDAPGSIEAPPEVLGQDPNPLQAEAEALAERSAAMQRSLCALLALEWVHGLDLLDIGLLGDGWIGPVVFRLLDDRGRLSGGMFAERLRLEGSASGRVVTLVLEEGSESHAGESVPFKDGVRRMLLPDVDPQPFRRALPELFPAEAEPGPADDGRFDLELLKVSLNRLLEGDATGDVYRLRHVGGVRGGVLLDVHLAVRDRGGSTQRHLFADRLRLAWLEQGIELVLEDGVSMRGDTHAPFLDGRYRIFLPRARRAAWEAAHLPGLSEPPVGSARAE